MDRQDDQRTLEALGDLFLTGPRPVNPPAKGMEAHVQSPSDPASTTTDTAAPLPPDPLAGPRPLRLPPKPLRPVVVHAQRQPPRPAPRRAAETDAPNEAAAGIPTLRLVGPPDAEPEDQAVEAAGDQTISPAPGARTPARFELVLLGNLPGFGGPWLTQYAHYLAEELGKPALVLHVDAEQVDCDLIGSNQQRQQMRQVQQLMAGPVKDGLLTPLRRLLAEGGSLVGAYIVHLPTPLAGEALEAAHDLRRWTMLLGADNVAVLGAYQWLKDLLSDAADVPRLVQLMFMGCDEQPAREATARLRQTCQLPGVTLQMIGQRRQMTPVQLEPLGSYGNDEELWPDLVAMLTGLDQELAEQLRQDEAGRALQEVAAVATPMPELLPSMDSTTADAAAESAGEDEQQDSTSPDAYAQAMAPPPPVKPTSNDAKPRPRPWPLEDDLPLEALLADTRLSRDIAAAEPLSPEEAEILIGAGYDDQTDEEQAQDDPSGDEDAADPRNPRPEEPEQTQSDSIRAFVARLQKQQPGPTPSAPAAEARKPLGAGATGKLEPTIRIPAHLITRKAATPAPAASIAPAAPVASEMTTKVEAPAPASAAPAAPMAAPAVAVAPAPSTAAASAAKPTPSAPAAAGVGESLDLSVFLLGTIKLAARCPAQPETQLVLDEAGRLHLLRQQREAEPQAAYLRLLEAQQWVKQHLELLQMTQRQLRFDPAAEPMLHLFTRQARPAVQLLRQLGDAVRLHLLDEVRLGSESTWYSTELN